MLPSRQRVHTALSTRANMQIEAISRKKALQQLLIKSLCMLNGRQTPTIDRITRTTPRRPVLLFSIRNYIKLRGVVINVFLNLFLSVDMKLLHPSSMFTKKELRLITRDDHIL